MRLENINNIGIIGGGLMGHGIAIQFARFGYKVLLNDLSEQHLDDSIKNIDSTCKIMNKTGIINNNEIKKIKENISTTLSLKHTSENSDFIVEAVFENIKVKQNIFFELDKYCEKDIVLASNTSSFKASQISEKCINNKTRVIVANWWNPPHILPLIEVVKAPTVSDQTATLTMELFSKINKKPVLLSKESLGFIGNRLQFALLREAISIVSNGIATPKEVDDVVKYSFGRRLSLAGPFEVFDAAGWDTITAIANELFPDLDNTNDEPDLLSEKLNNDHLGMKTDKGFYIWNDQSKDNYKEKIISGLTVIDKI
tara:strand:+ start:8713 stop:9651 length:939 start_codon:yes stop_codon:yes gene_type:complete